jgi:hypothetical protein
MLLRLLGPGRGLRGVQYKLSMTHKCVIVQVGEPNEKNRGNLYIYLLLKLLWSVYSYCSQPLRLRNVIPLPAVTVMNSGVTYSLSQAAQLHAL